MHVYKRRHTHALVQVGRGGSGCGAGVPFAFPSGCSQRNGAQGDATEAADWPPAMDGKRQLGVHGRSVTKRLILSGLIVPRGNIRTGRARRPIFWWPRQKLPDLDLPHKSPMYP